MKPRSDDANAFIPDPSDGPVRRHDALADTLAEDFVQAATSGNSTDEDVFDSVVPEENGGPFIVTSGEQEFARGTDESNPPGAYAEPLPLTNRGLAAAPAGGVETTLDGDTDGDDDTDSDDE